VRRVCPLQLKNNDFEFKAIKITYLLDNFVPVYGQKDRRPDKIICG
jgi:hypothetical protein